jgi:two-component system response regulator YesN
MKNHPPTVQTDPLIDDVCALLRDTIESRIPLSELCADFPLSYVRLRERFVARTGMSMGQYQLKFRMEQASRLLGQGKSVKEVAYLLGYSDPSAFSKQFKQVLGISPSAYSKSPRSLPPQPRP